MSSQIASVTEEAIAARMMGKAMQLLEQRRPAEALPMLERLKHQASIPNSVHEAHASALLALGRFGEAEHCASVALAASPTHGSLLQLRGRARAAMGAHVEALDDAAAAVMADAGSTSARCLMADALLKVGKFDEAIFLNWRMVQAQPQDVNAHLRLAQAFMMGSRHAAADELLREVESRAPLLAMATALRAQNKLLSGDNIAAEAILLPILARGHADASLYSVLAHALVAQGRLAEAGPHFRAAARLAPDDAYLAHLASASDGGTPERASNAYVATVFDGYAPRFEAELLSMGYRVPGLIRLAVESWLAESHHGESIPGAVLDLGCGTGLVGVALLGLTHAGLTGIDLSQNMIRETAAKGIYNKLHHAEVTATLSANLDHYALVTAGDVFCYFGDLREVVMLAAAKLVPNGRLMFSVEACEDTLPWRLDDSGRYQHTAAHLSAVLQDAGLEALRIQSENLRLNGGEPVVGFFVVARKAPH